MIKLPKFYCFPLATDVNRFLFFPFYRGAILGYMVFAGLISLIYIILLRWQAKLMVYTIIFITWISTIAYIVKLFQEAKKMEDVNLKSNKTSGAIFLAIVFVVSVILVLAFRKKIAISCAMIQEASK